MADTNPTTISADPIIATTQHAEGVSGFGLTVHTDAVIDALNEIHNAEENDIIFSDDEMPEQKELL